MPKKAWYPSPRKTSFAISWRWLLAALLGPAATLVSLAQAPVVQRAALAPTANARTAPAGTTIQIPFSQPIAPTTAGGVRVFSAQYRGRRTATASTSGSTVTLVPGAGAFRPGETVQVSVPATVYGTNSVAAVPCVYQFTAAAARAPATFPSTPPGLSVGTGPGPNAVVAADVDGDGDLDLLVANTAGNTVSVRLNTGNGTTFTAAPNVSVGGAPTSLAAADVDGNGTLDLLVLRVVYGSPSTVRVYLNTGNGTFANPTSVTMGSESTSLAAADLDGDGNLDLLTANGANNTVSVRLNTGGGTFTGSASVPVGAYPYSVVAADMNGDGSLDLLAANTSGSSVSVRLNNGSGAFTGTTEVGVSGYPRSVAAADVDGDGDLDLLVPEDGRSRVSVFINDGSGTAFTPYPSVYVGNSPNSIVTADVDGDGDLDLLTANYADNTVSVRFNTGIGVFTGSASVLVGSNPLSVVAADLDGDGTLDLLTADEGDNTVSVRLSPATPLPVTLVDFTARPTGPNTVALTWATASEAGSAYFAVQRSPDGIAWTELGRVAAAGGSTSLRQYAYPDASSLPGTSYYRLRQADLDGTSVYSPVRAVTRGGVGPALYPNPAPAGGVAILSGATPGQAVQVFDALGRVAATATIAPDGTVPLSGLTPGLYVVRTNSGPGQRLAIE